MSSSPVTHVPISMPARHRPVPQAPSSLRKVLLACGIASSVLYAAANALVPLFFQGYSYRDQTVSELSAIGAPTRGLWLALMVPYELLVLAFAAGVWITGRRSRPLRVVAGTMMVYAVFGSFWPPMHLREALAAGGGTTSDLLHIVWTMVVAPLMMVSIGFGAAAFGKRFRIYSASTLAVLIAFGVLTGLGAPRISVNLPTPWIGVWERINIGAFMLWVAVFAAVLLRAQERRAAMAVTGVARSGLRGAGRMGWLVLFIVLAVLAGVGVAVNVNRLRFERSVTEEQRALLASASAPRLQRGDPSLPPPVARHKELAVGSRRPVRALRMRHGGTFCMSPTAKPVPIRGTQLFTAEPPGFVWTGRVRTAPGVWIDARDMVMAGKGNMRVLLDDTIPIADARGENTDQAATLRLLAEMPWFPTALFDERYVAWSAIDADHARATLRIGDRDVWAVFEFGADGLPVGVTAARFTDKGELRPWGGTYRDYRSISGMLVPFEAHVTWQLETGPFTYAHWLIETMEFDEAAPPSTRVGASKLQPAPSVD